MIIAMPLLVYAAAAGPVAIAQASATDGANGTTTVTSVEEGGGSRVVIVTDRHDGARTEHAGSEPRREVRVLALNGPGGGDCGGEPPIVDEASPDGKDRTRILLCGHGALSAADRSAQLEHVLERVQHMDALSDSSKERVAAALREAIERLHSAH